MGGSILQEFNINELAGAIGLILGAVSGILVVVFRSRCYCKLRLCGLCFCERKPPPDPEPAESEDDETVMPDKAKPKHKSKKPSDLEYPTDNP